MTVPIHRGLLLTAGVMGLTAVLAGTFGAHGLRGRISEAMLANYHTGVHYHLTHALAVLAIAIIAGLMPARASIRAAGWCMVGGVIVFSGSLYVMAITNQRWLGMITPIGGVLLLIGWLLVIVTAARTAGSPSARDR